MKKIITLSLATAMLAIAGQAQPLVVFDFDSDSVGTLLTDAADSVGSSSFSGTSTGVTVDANNDIVFGFSTSNYFGNAALPATYSTQTLELAFTVTGYDISAGDAGGAVAGFGLRNIGATTDLFAYRIIKTSGTVKLQHRIGTTNTNLVDFGNTADTFTTLDARAVVDLAANTVDFYWSIDGGAESSSLGVAVADLDIDGLRAVSNLVTPNMGSGDFVSFDDVSVTLVPEPSTYALLGGMFALALVIYRRRK
jgi:hypothetical protein